MSRGPKPPDPVNGLLLVDKPAGMTSHDVVHKVRRHFGLRKTGHGGTLDPMATGLLVLLLGRGTKASDAVMRGDKVYSGTLRLGQETDTQDAQGQVVAEAPWDAVGRDDLLAAMAAWIGEHPQVPPMVSAIKQQGRKLYELARKGVSVEREPRTIRVDSWDLLAWNPPRADFQLACAKGTYVRTLCADVGHALGCGAHLAALRRERSGSFDVNQALPLEDVLQLDLEGLAARVLPTDTLAPAP